MTSGKKKIGIFGGTFNPIHYGHLMIAENACCQYGLEKVIFLPTGHAPHKRFAGDDMTVHRCKMTEIAIADNSKFEISYHEIETTDVNYTYNTLDYFQNEYPGYELYFILGADSLFDFEQWKCPEEICKRAIILAAVRDDLAGNKLEEQIQYLSKKYNGIIYRMETPNFSVSSKGLRERVANNQTIRYMVPSEVEHYIQEQKLYQKYYDCKHHKK